ncbi:MAG: hypothetical protein AMJ59_06680 [Gammaproteobacteria bacterium SG8_31]|nr:MAG: hypothetical protein AMJ59_06680 [Gammaproteobacteria bacterium SG8_31]
MVDDVTETAGDDLAQRSERIEAEALSEFHRAASPALRDAMGLRLETIDGALVSVAARSANIVINRVIGLGMDSPATVAQLETIRRVYGRAGVERFFVHASAAAEPRPLAGFLEGEGLVRDRGWMKFSRRGNHVTEPAMNLVIREIGPEDATAFGRIAGQGFGLGEPAWDVLARLVGRPGWRIFMSFDGGAPAGVGALFVSDGVGWTDWAATDPAFRQKGSQSALLARRINAAVEMGCSLLCTCTGEAVADEDQHSYRNILRAGFIQAGLRPNYSPTGRPV